jgi:hypothetical protein
MQKNQKKTTPALILKARRLRNRILSTYAYVGQLLTEVAYNARCREQLAEEADESDMLYFGSLSPGRVLALEAELHQATRQAEAVARQLLGRKKSEWLKREPQRSSQQEDDLPF